MWHRVLLSFILLIGLMSVVIGVGAQNETCLAIADTTFNTLADSCGDTAASSACFVMDATADSTIEFNQAGDTVPLSDLNVLTTGALDLESETWGAVRLNVPANVPLSISDRGLAFLLIGDAQLENVVNPDTAYSPVAPVILQTLVGANLRSAPTTDARVVASAPVGAELSASGLSSDQGWVYITYEDTIAWVSTQIVLPLEGDLNTLPIVSNNSRSLMQDFVLITGTESSPCSPESPSMLLLRAPEGVTASVTVNEAEFRFADSVVLRTTSNNELQLFVLAGSASNGVLSVPPGFTVSVPLTADLRSVNGSWQGLRPITDAERGWLSILEQVPVEVMYAAISVPTNEQVAQTLRSVNQASSGTAQSVSASGSGNCANFRPTSPLDGLVFGTTTFYWDGVAGADQYRVNVFTNGQIASSRTIDALSTTTTIDTSSNGIGDGQSYGWNVEAISNGQVICTSGTVTMLRGANTQAVGTGGNTGSGTTDNACTWGCN